MLTKKQFLALLTIYILYMLVGAAIFYHIERREEFENREVARRERHDIEELLNKHYVPSDEDTQEEIFDKLTAYCGKPMTTNMTEIEDPPKWDYYHSVFFVITVVSTIGYGNLSPTTMLSRIFLIFYAFIGIPINGIVMVAMGGYFGKSFESLYNRWKKSSMKYDFAKLGLVTQIILYLIPGFMFFIFIPAMIFMLFEGWEYDVSVYYAFVTLSTIGFGDYCAGDERYEYSYTVYWIYKVFLLFWVIIGLGYLSMIIEYISRAMTSSHVKQLEHLISTHIKKTPLRIRDELRSLLNEALLARVKRVYKQSVHEHPAQFGRSQSCPDLSIYRNSGTPTMVQRKRALSECPYGKVLNRIQSDTDLQFIDKERTFSSSEAPTEPNDLLLRVVNALGSYEEDETSPENDGVADGGIQLFSDAQILESEKLNGNLDTDKLSSLPTYFERQRYLSEGTIPTYEKPDKLNLTWYGQSAAQKLQELRERVKYGKSRRRTLAAPISQPLSLLTRIKNTFKPNKTEDKQNIDIERQDYIQRTPRGRWSVLVDEQDRYLRQTRGGRLSTLSNMASEEVLENTSIAEFIRALTAISIPGTAENIEAVNILPIPKRKFGVASMTPLTRISPPRARRVGMLPQSRRNSLLPSTSQHIRRFSLRPVVEDNPSTKEAKASPLRNVFKTRSRTTSMSTSKEETDAESRLASEQPPAYASQDVRSRPPVVRRYSLRSGTVTTAPSPVQKQVQAKRDKDKDKDDHDKSC